MTVSATIVMLFVMTFRIPGGFQGALFTLIISRESLAETFLSGFRTALVFLIGWQYLVSGDTTRCVVFHDSLLPALRGFAPELGSLDE